MLLAVLGLESISRGWNRADRVTKGKGQVFKINKVVLDLHGPCKAVSRATSFHAPFQSRRSKGSWWSCSRVEETLGMWQEEILGMW